MGRLCATRPPCKDSVSAGRARHHVTRLTRADAERFIRIRRRMLTESPWAFAADPGDDQDQDPVRLGEMLDAEESAVLDRKSVV